MSMDRRKFVSRSAITGLGLLGLSACSTTEKVGNETSIDVSILSLSERQRWLRSFSCNIELWFRDLPLLDRINAAKELGFTAVEMWNPNVPKRGRVPAMIAQRAKEQGIRMTSYSPGAPHFGDAKNETAFMIWLQQAIVSGKTLDIPNFNLTGHKLIEGLSVDQMIENYTRVLKRAAPILEDAEMVATIEPYNPFNHKGHFIYGNEPGLSICREVNSSSVKLNWDFFHMQRTNGNLVTNLENGIDQVAYVQLADSPDRNQPGTGEVAYGVVLSRLRSLGYKGWIGAECRPKDKDAVRAASDLAQLAKGIDLVDPVAT